MARRRRREPDATELQLAAATINAGHSVMALTNAFQDVDAPQLRSSEWQRRLARDTLYETARTLTPHGTICRETTVNGKTGPLEIFHVNPFALLHHSAATAHLFMRFIGRLVEEAPRNLLDIVF